MEKTKINNEIIYLMIDEIHKTKSHLFSIERMLIESLESDNDD